ncbi:U3 small nucleolar RNA-associated protein 6 homolog [Megalobrama amblycephala]|uniref:U3 small nucleolar RNA-associated protein 6 homolog n=1 Tax=Megalobrama amblycephala TaxID=75352 RepID=UPI0020142DF3|nr:U3 small nucleolar RNA-associated protein 6 homolog [Megalobrama amblycephala]
MADIVQQRLEDRIPALQQLERVGLFTNKEVKSMLKRSTALEYKLHRAIQSKDDFITYIQYEINVLELIKKRRSRIKYHFKREEIEYPFIHRINNVFRRATTKWQDDVQLWLSQVAFNKKWGTKSQLSKVLSTMLAIHPDKPALWIMAAKCEMEDRNSSESARHLFLRALRFHPENKKIYQEYFRMELMHAEKLRKQQQELEQAQIDVGEYTFSPEIMSGKLAEVVYRDGAQKIKGAEFILSLLQIAAIFDFTKELQDTILQDLQSQYNDDYLMWDFMAKRELDAAGAPELQSAKGRASDTDRREDRCCAVYEEALKNLNTEAMWTCYVTFCLERYKRKTNITELKEKRKQRLLRVLQSAHDAKLLQETFYKNWLQVLLSSGDTVTATQIAITATQHFSQSLEMWSFSLQTLVHLESAEAGHLFQEALKHVNPKESLPLWQLQADWSMTSQTPEETETFFKKGLLSPVPAVSSAMKEKYLEWSYKTGGYKRARKTFRSLHEHRPFTKAFFLKMIQIEKEQETPKMSNLRDYYERALREFGSSDENLWMDYIKEELGRLGNPENCGKLHWRAIKTLEGERVESFTTQYTLLQTGNI